MWGLNLQPQDQESHILPTEPARRPLAISFFDKSQTFRLDLLLLSKFFFRNKANGLRGGTINPKGVNQSL